MTSPTQRSLKLLRSQGWLAGVVEKWNQHARIRQDLFGFVDIVAVRGKETLAVQTTTADNLAKRIAKAKALPEFSAVAAAMRVEFHGWAKRGGRGQRKTWTVRIECE